MIEEDGQKIKEDEDMMTGTALKMDNNLFNQFLKTNKDKISSIIPKNPSISKSDEWYREDFWDEDQKESNN